jgi:hypothetical protein
MFIAPCRVPEAIRRDVHAAFGREGVDTAAIERIVEDTPYRCTIRRDDLLADGQPWARLEYAALVSPDVEGTAEWTFEERTPVPGFAVWFTTELASGIGFSTEPGSPVRVYSQIYLPLRREVAMARGERLRVHLALRLVRTDYIWAWTVRVTSPGGRERDVLSQNSLAEGILDPSRLHRHAAEARTAQTNAGIRRIPEDV